MAAPSSYQLKQSLPGLFFWFAFLASQAVGVHQNFIFRLPFPVFYIATYLPGYGVWKSTGVHGVRGAFAQTNTRGKCFSRDKAGSFSIRYGGAASATGRTPGRPAVLFWFGSTRGRRKPPTGHGVMFMAVARRLTERMQYGRGQWLNEDGCVDASMMMRYPYMFDTLGHDETWDA